MGFCDENKCSECKERKNEKVFLLLLMISFASAFSFSSAQAKTLEADVVIVGGGTAVMPAAVAAAENGASVIVFEKTVDEYNKPCEAGRDPLFNKDPKYLRPIKEPRFYASKGSPPGGYGSLGGMVNGT